MVSLQAPYRCLELLSMLVRGGSIISPTDDRAEHEAIRNVNEITPFPVAPPGEGICDGEMAGREMEAKLGE